VSPTNIGFWQKFYVSNASFVRSQNSKYQLHLPKQTIATAAFVRSP